MIRHLLIAGVLLSPLVAADGDALMLKAIQQSRQRQSSRVSTVNAKAKPSTQQQQRSIAQSRSIDVEALNNLIKTLDKTWVFPKAGGKEPIGSNFQYKKTCASIYKARPGACSQLGFGTMCFNYCHEKGEKVSYQCVDASDAAYCKSSSNFDSFLTKYKKDTYKAKAYVHQMISRCFATAICGASGILDAAPSETSTPKTRGELGHLKLTRPPAQIGEGAAVKGKGTNASRRTKAPKGVTTTTATTTTAAPEASGSTKKKSLPIWQKLMNKGSTTPRIPTTEHDLEIHEVISARGTEAEIKSTELPTDESGESEESTPSSTTRTTGGGPKKQRPTATATPTTRVTWKPLVRATTVSAGTDGPSHTSEKSTKEQTFWNRFQPNTWYQSIHYFTNTGR